jgi:hypothetical protein
MAPPGELAKVNYVRSPVPAPRADIPLWQRARRRLVIRAGQRQMLTSPPGTRIDSQCHLTSNLGLAAAVAAAMLGAYLVTFVIARYALHKPLGLSALTALAVGAPAVPFAGVVVLGYLYGPTLITVPVAPAVLIYRSPVRKLLADPGDVEDDDFAGGIVC